MWNVAAGTLTGPAHRAAGTPNQDALGHVLRGDLFLGAVSDGAGSLELSHEGSSLAVATALEFMDSHADASTPFQALVFGGVEAARLALLTLDGPKRYGCTLSLVACDGESWAVACVGDSFVVTTDEDEIHTFHTGEALGEYANQTRLLTSDSLGTTYAAGYGALTAVALSSDGLLPLGVVADEAHAPFWDPIVGRVRADNLSVDALLGHMDTRERILDDSTLLVAARRL